MTYRAQCDQVFTRILARVAAAALCRQHAISEQTYYRWKAKYGGMDSSEAKRLKQLEDENRKLKHVVADLTLDNGR